MRVILLAAGKGERLKEVTSRIPKPMIEFNGKPVLAHNIDLCKKFNFTQLFVNLHHLPEIIKDYFGNGEKFGVSIEYSYEAELLGTAGAVRKIADDYWKIDKSASTPLNEDNDFFFVMYGDNYSAYDLDIIYKKILATQSIGVIGLHYREDTEHSGVAEFADDGRIERFIEKPKLGESTSHWVNAGIYCFNRRILNFIPAGVSDFSKDIFPSLIRANIPLYGVCQQTEVKAFDTPEMYKNSIKG